MKDYKRILILEALDILDDEGREQLMEMAETLYRNEQEREA